MIRKKPRIESPDPFSVGTKGFSLVLVVFLVAIVTGVVLDGTLRARVQRSQVSNAVAAVRARAVAQAGVAHGVVRLRDLHAQLLAQPDAPQQLLDLWNHPRLIVIDLGHVQTESGWYRVDIEDASGKLCLNHATERELVSLLKALGATSSEAQIAAQSILDWRDTDDLYREHGAEWDHYYSNGAEPTRPRNAPFESVRELALVRGMEMLYERTREHVRVTGDGRVNLNSAQLPVLIALPGIGEEAAVWLWERQRRGEQVVSLEELASNLKEPARALLQAEYADLSARALFQAHTFEIEATGWVEGEGLSTTLRALAVPSGASIQIVRQWEL